MRVVVSPAADRDIHSHAVFIGADSLAAGYAFFDHVARTLAHLAEFPRQGRVRRRPRKGLPIRAVRVFGFPNHLVYYTVSARTLRIVRVLHGAVDRRRFRGPRLERPYARP
jgi:plasmid stabilization system protein ParE